MKQAAAPDVCLHHFDPKQQVARSIVIPGGGILLFLFLNKNNAFWCLCDNQILWESDSLVFAPFSLCCLQGHGVSLKEAIVRLCCHSCQRTICKR